MWWMTTVALNLLIALCYVGISGLIWRGLMRTHQLTTNPLALATSLIFLSCALHHSHHALHVKTGGAAVQGLYGTWHSILIDLAGAVVAVTYLGMRRRYGALLNTPSMFEDRVAAETERRLRDFAYRDQLTGVRNRRSLAELADELDRSQDHPVLVAYLDLDDFKPVNDTFGHDAGDTVLQTIAARLTDCLEPGEHLFRMGGDEFLVVAQQPRLRATDTADRLRHAVTRPCELATGDVVQVGCSVGLAPGLTGTDAVEDLVRRADAAMYLAKRQRSGVATFDNRMWLPQTPQPRRSTDQQLPLG